MKGCRLYTWRCLALTMFANNDNLTPSPALFSHVVQWRGLKCFSMRHLCYIFKIIVLSFLYDGA